MRSRRACGCTPVARLFAVAIATAILAVAAAATSAHAGVITGIATQYPAPFASPLFTALGIDSVRLDVPWDAGTTSGPWDGWLQQAHALGLNVLVALDHDPGTDCPYTDCTLVPVTSYESALRALLMHYPWITEIEAWNEPNDNTEPTAADPAAAAGYYEAAAKVCPACTVVAGDFLDGPTLPGYLHAYQAALTDVPRVWGLHNYFDATYDESDGVDTMLAATQGSLWLTETGGLVSEGTLPADEARAAQSIDWLYDLAATRPRISRVYIYSWVQGTSGTGFDSGLLRADGTPRPSYWAVLDHTNPSGVAPPSPAAPAPASGSAPATPQPVAPVGTPAGPQPASAQLGQPSPPDLKAELPTHLNWAGRRALTLKISCVSAPAGLRCIGVVRLRGAGAAADYSAAVGQTVTLRLPLSARAARRLHAEHPATVAAQLCNADVCASGARVPVLPPRRS